MGEIRSRTPWSELLWQAWGSLGVASWTREGIDTVVDPEALIVLTLLIGEDRLIFETVDWAILHIAVINVSRLRYLAREAGAARQAERWLATVAVHAAPTWRARVDDGFAGFSRSGKSMPAPTAGASGAALRLRAVAGASTRAEVIRALHPNARGLEGGRSTKEIARRVGATGAQVRVALEELFRADLVRRDGTERRRVYATATRDGDAILSGVWSAWRALAWGPWRDVAIVGSALTAIDAAVQRPGPESVVAALDARALVQDAMKRSCPDLAGHAPTGSLDVVRHAVRDWSQEATSRFIAQLRDGVPRPGTADAGLSSARETGSANPWQTNAAWAMQRGTNT